MAPSFPVQGAVLTPLACVPLSAWPRRTSTRSSGLCQPLTRRTCERLSAWPIETIERVLYEWPSRSKFWPTWKELADELPDRGQLRLAHGDGNTWAARTQRLGITAKRLAYIGVAQWRHVMARHRELRDDEVLAAISRLERGEEAFPE